MKVGWIYLCMDLEMKVWFVRWKWMVLCVNVLSGVFGMWFFFYLWVIDGGNMLIIEE